MKIVIKTATAFPLHLLLMIYLTISTTVVCFLDKTATVVVYSQILLFVTFFWIVWVQIKLNGIMHLFTLFLGIFFVYLLGLPFYDLLGWINVEQQVMTVPVKLSGSTLVITYTYTSFFLMLLFLGVLLGYKDHKHLQNFYPVTYKKFLYQIGLVLFLYALPGTIIKYYLRYQHFMERGYLAGYDGSVDTINFPIICFGASAILVLGYCFILSSHPSKRQFLIISCVFLLTQALNTLKGQRMLIIFPMIFVFWAYARLYAQNLSIKKILLFMACVVVVSGVMLVYRGDKIRNFPGIKDYTLSFFTEQGVSFLILPTQIELNEHIKNTSYPYILNPLIPHGSNNFNNKYMQYVAPEAHKKGYGVGDSILLQFYDLPHAIAGALCILLGFMVARFEIYLKGRRFLLFSSYYFLFAVLIVRYDFLGMFYTWLASAVIWMIINCWHKGMLSRRASRKNIAT
jgi:oligosaccharide repeat unit polymerase